METMDSLLPSKLLPGDVIFFENRYMSPDGSVDYTYIDHVTIFTGRLNDSLPIIVHSICDGYGHYYPEPVSGVCVTTLVPLLNQVQAPEPGRDSDNDIETRYDVGYKVFRFIGRDSEKIRNKAVSLLVRQSRYRIPYDERRLRRKYERESAGWEGRDFVTHARSVYSQGEGLFRAIKFAARDPKPWTRQSPATIKRRREGEREQYHGRGLTCSMAVVLAYQVAELLVDERVRPSAGDQWPSDKHSMDSREGESAMPEGFAEYLKVIRGTVTERGTTRLQLDDDETLCASYTFWRDREQCVSDYRHSSYAVDCKSIGAEGMFAYMTECVNSWHYIGELSV